MRRVSSLFLFLVTLLCLPSAGCGEQVSPEERALLERQKFSVELVSWAPVGEEQLALDLSVTVEGKSDLQQLTVVIRQVGAEQEELQSDLVPLDVAGMGFDDLKPVTVSVKAVEGVAAVGVLLESIPDPAERSRYPELAG
jgi:hypothetical protein